MAVAPTVIPLRGSLGALDTQNPNLLPLMDLAMSSGNGTLDAMSPAKYLASNPRVNATLSITVGGSITNLDTVALRFTSPLFPGGVYTTAPYTIVTADTTQTVAEALDDMIDNDIVLTSLGMSGELQGTGAALQVNLLANGPVSNGVTVTAVKTGAGTITLTFGNSGVIAGGSGPIIPTSGFSFSYNGCTINFQYGKPVVIGSDLLAQLVAQGRPVI